MEQKRPHFSWMRTAMWVVTLGVTGVICFAKQFINVVQIVNASTALAHIDREERAKALTAKKQ